MQPVVRLTALRDQPLDVAEVIDAVSDDAAGGVNVFIGKVRDHDHGKSVTRLEYEAHPTAQAELERVAAGVAEKYDVRAIAAVHRVGNLELGDLAVVIAVAAAHRGEAYEASRALIDELKATVPIWKHQHFTDGSDEWVGAC
ncbi:MAG: molybdenum cofactor biosynthesis protein MoaE [Nocardioidaceae bacterium]|nr:MAG: molybdenum cofactor biosynthesis protein MoaE [Nocardioidaceae bacterium]